MNKSVTKFIKTVKRGFGKRSPEILLGIGIASGITTTILESNVTKAKQKYERATIKANTGASAKYKKLQTKADNYQRKSDKKNSGLLKMQRRPLSFKLRLPNIKQKPINTRPHMINEQRRLVVQKFDILKLKRKLNDGPEP